MMKIREEKYYFKFYEEQNIKQTIVYLKQLKDIQRNITVLDPFNLQIK